MTTSLYAALLALMFLWLSINVVKGRRQFRVAMGHSDSFDVLRRMRAQANFAEYAPFFLLLLALAEYNHLP